MPNAQHVLANDAFLRPGLMVRIKSALIDSMVTISLLFLTITLFNTFGIDNSFIKFSGFLLACLYEPIMTTFYRTLGQKTMAIRVVSAEGLLQSNSKINIGPFQAILRYATKLFFSWLSMITMHQTAYNQAIHDKVSDSLVIYDRSLA